MKVLIAGAGRGGTNWATEIVRASGQFNFTEPVEDRGFFEKDLLPDKYGTKLATENWGFTLQNLRAALERHPDLHIVWVIRHPYDLALSKIYRGLPKSQGGYTTEEKHADTPQSAVDAVRYMAYLYDSVRHHDRVTRIYMEDMIMSIESVVEQLCAFLNIDEVDEMYDAQRNVRSPYHQASYGGEVDKSQVRMHENWQRIYDGYFADKWEIMSFIARELAATKYTLDYMRSIHGYSWG